MITIEEKNAIRFYQGDIRQCDKNGKILNDKNNEGFYGIHSAYRTINCFMFDGISNEKERIRENNGSLFPDICLEIEKVIDIYCKIFSAMRKSINRTENINKMLLYRTDRGISVDELKKGYTVSFTSTSKENNPGSYFKKKSNLTLLEIEFSDNLPHLDFEKVLGNDYLYGNQKEILLPPFLMIEMTRLELNEIEKKYRDANNRPPYAKYHIWVKGIKNYNHEEEIKELTDYRNKRAKLILEKLVKNETLTDEDIKEYSLWKKDVQAIIWENFKNILG